MKPRDGKGDLSLGEASRPTLVRALGPGIAVAAVVGSVIGSGIFLKPGSIAAQGGQFGLIISVWLLGGVLCLLGGLCFAELAAMLPRAGGLYVYLREAYGRPVAFLFGWSEFLFNKPASIGALAVAFVGSLTLATRRRISPLGEVLLASALISAMAWVNVIGVIWGGRLQLAFTLVKASFLALVAAAPLLLIPWIGPSIELANYRTTIEPREPGLSLQIGAVLLAVMWAYNGWHDVTPLAEEIRDPRRNIPLALLTGIGLVIALYVSANAAYHGVMSMEEMSRAGDHAVERMLEKLLGAAGLTTMSAVILCSTFGALNANLLMAPRVSFAMGRDGVFFRGLGRVHPGYRTPATAICVTAAMAVALVVAAAAAKHFAGRSAAAESNPQATAAADGAPGHTKGQSDARTPADEGIVPLVVKSLRNDSIFALLTNCVIFASSIFYMVGGLAVIVLRRRRPQWERPYRTWGYPVVPILFSAAYVWFLCRVYDSNPLESRTGLLFIALGLPVYFAYQRWSRRRNDEA